MAPKALGPGVRFHPTDVELVKYYLQKKVTGKRIRLDVISEVDVYKFSPSDLPDKSQLKSLDLEWYFFCPRERKYANGARMNRATECGYWKTTGRDRTVKYNDKTVGMIKTLIYHEGRAPHGNRTDWVMHEYRLKDEDLAKSGISQDAYVICKIFLKSGPGPRPTQHFFKESDWSDDDDDSSLDACPLTGSSFLSTLNMNNPDCSIVTSLGNPGRISTDPFIGAGPSKSITGLTGAHSDSISQLEIPTTLKEFPSVETMQKDVSISELPQVPNSHMFGIQNTYTSHMQCQTGLHGDASSLPELPNDGKFSTWAMCSGGNCMLPSMFHGEEVGYLNEANCGGMDHPANLAWPDYHYELDSMFDLGVQSGCANSYIELDDLITPLENGIHWSHLIPSDGFNEFDNHHTEVTSFNSKNEYGGNSSIVALAEPLLLPVSSCGRNASADTSKKDNDAGNTNNLFFCTEGWRP